MATTAMALGYHATADRVDMGDFTMRRDRNNNNSSRRTGNVGRRRLHGRVREMIRGTEEWGIDIMMPDNMEGVRGANLELPV